MSLTKEAYLERKWARFPALRQALEDKNLPGHYYGPSSISDNLFDQMTRLVEISKLAIEYKEEILSLSESVSLKELTHELNNLTAMLFDMQAFWEQMAESVQLIAREAKEGPANCSRNQS